MHFVEVEAGAAAPGWCESCPLSDPSDQGTTTNDQRRRTTRHNCDNNFAQQQHKPQKPFQSKTQQQQQQQQQPSLATAPLFVQTPQPVIFTRTHDSNNETSSNKFSSSGGGSPAIDDGRGRCNSQSAGEVEQVIATSGDRRSVCNQLPCKSVQLSAERLQLSSSRSVHRPTGAPGWPFIKWSSGPPRRASPPPLGHRARNTQVLQWQ